MRCLSKIEPMLKITTEVVSHEGTHCHRVVHHLQYQWLDTVSQREYRSTVPYSYSTCFPVYSAAAVASDLTRDPMRTPCSHENDSYTRGTPSGRRPPKIIASIGTPEGMKGTVESTMGQIDYPRVLPTWDGWWGIDRLEQWNESWDELTCLKKNRLVR